MKPVHLLPHIDGLADELHKIAAGQVAAPPPEAQGDLVPMAPPPLPARALLASWGAGSLAASAPLLKRWGLGRDMLYHATDPTAAQGILSTEGGIDPAFAGAGQRNIGAALQAAAPQAEAPASSLAQTARQLADQGVDFAEPIATAAAGGAKPAAREIRLNRYGLSENLNRLLESHGVPLAKEDILANSERFHQLMDSGVKAQPAAQQVFQEASQRLLAKGAVTPEKLKTLEGKLGPQLSRFGLRSYWGVHPADVAPYSLGMNEQGINQVLRNQQTEELMQKGLMRGLAGSMVDSVTGGLPTLVHDIRDRLKYKPHSQETMTHAKATEYLQGLQREIESRLPDGLRHSPEEIAKLRPTVTFGAEVPTGHMDYFTDFPIARRMLEINPGMKTNIKQTFPTHYDPGKDVSLPHSTPRKNIKFMDIHDPTTGKIHRVNFSEFEHSARGPLLKRVGKAAVPAALAAWGVHNIYRAIRPKKKMVPKTHPMALLPKGDDDKTKTAGVWSDVGHVAKEVLPASLALGALGVGAHMGMEKLVPHPTKAPNTLKEKAEQSAKQSLRISIPMLIPALGATGIGAYKGYRKAGLPGAAIGGYLGFGAGSLIGGGAIGGREMAHYPEADPHWSMLPDAVQEKVRQHPILGAAKGFALGTVPILGGAYLLRKYYPSAYHKLPAFVGDAAKKALNP